MILNHILFLIGLGSIMTQYLYNSDIEKRALLFILVLPALWVFSCMFLLGVLTTNYFELIECLKIALPPAWGGGLLSVHYGFYLAGVSDRSGGLPND